MNIKIGEKIKSLRRKADVTQDKLADYLGITPQAISRWESGGVYPDIEIIPSIANFFNVTTDELLGVDVTKNQEKIDKIHAQLLEKAKKGLIKDQIDILRNAIQEFPNNYELLGGLARNLHHYGDSLEGEEKQKYLKESISISERILQDCLDDETRFGTLQGLAYTYKSAGEREKAIETANRLPFLYCTNTVVLGTLFEGEKQFSHLKSNVKMYADLFTRDLSILAREKYRDKTDVESLNKKITLYRKAITIWDILFEEKDYGFYHVRLYEYYWYLADNYAILKDEENTLDCIEKSAKHAIIHDNEHEYTGKISLINEKEPSDSNEFYSTRTAEYNNSYELLNYLKYKQFDFVRDTKRFKAVIAELEKYAKKEE